MDFDVDQMLSWVKQQTELGPRRAGSPAGRKNEDLLVGELKSFGIESVRTEPIDVTHCEAARWRFDVESGGSRQSLDCFPIPFAAYTPAEGIDARLVYADRHKLWHTEDWNGAIVVTDIGFPELEVKMLLRLSSGHYDPDSSLRNIKHPATWVRLGWHLYHLAARRGAVGFVGILEDQPGGSCEMYAPYGFREPDILNKPVPGLWVGRNQGAALRRLAKSGHARGSLVLTGAREKAVTHNIVAELPGKSSETMVLSCHHDSPFVSPVEDASGVAVVLALAKHFAEKRDLERRLVVLLSAGHFYGSIGTRTFIKEHPNVVADTVVEITIEHIAKEAVEDSEGNLVPSGKPEAAGIFVPFNRAVTDAVLESMKAQNVSRVVALPAEGPLGDYPPTDGGDWWEAGVPVINYISNPVYLLTNDDALDWVDVPRMPKVATAFADIIRRLDHMPRAAIAEVESRRRVWVMKALKHINRAKTTTFGLKPVY